MTNRAYSLIIGQFKREIAQKDEKIKRLQKECDAWRDKYNALCDQISLEEGWDPSLEED